jgi:CxxC motif-containing protein
MNITELSGGKYDISGYKCERGKVYAEQEIVNPSRILTTTIKIKNGFIKRLPVRSKEPIPKDKILKCMEVLRKIEKEAPISEGDIIIENIFNMGINIVASKDISKDCSN